MVQIIVNEDILNEARIALERIHVLSDELAQGYFGNSDRKGNFNNGDLFLKTDYEQNRVFCEIVREFSYDTMMSIMKALDEAEVYSNKSQGVDYEKERTKNF